MNNENRKCVLVTRSTSDSLIIERLLEKKEIDSILWSPITITETNVSIDETDFKKAQLIIILSKNAIQTRINRYLKKYSTKMLCIGKGSAEKIFEQTHNKPAYISNSSSEVLLENKRVKEAEKILILKGEKGRGILERELIKKEKEVKILNLYRREKNKANTKTVKTIRENAPLLITATSVEILDQITTLYVNESINLKKITVVTFSNRISQRAFELGYKNTLLVNQMNNKGIVEKILEYYEK